tara:strand:- start:422 stop:1204 length:783 start_codon:yes stop_codon:yes gene_type:complete
MGIISQILGFGKRSSNKSKAVSKMPRAKMTNVLVDMHSHLIPGIDDGVETYEEAIEIIKSMMHAGYRKLITTPHVMSDGYPNTTEIILSGFETLKNKVEEEGLEIDLEVAAEYYVDAHFESLVNKGDILTIGDNNVLIEFSYLNKPINYKDILVTLFEKGYKPILAHPERYVFLQNDKSGFDELKDMGVQFQLNLFSLIGLYDRASQYHGRRLIEKEMVDYLGTDIHRSHQIKHFKRALSSRYLHYLIKENQLKNLFLKL